MFLVERVIRLTKVFILHPPNLLRYQGNLFLLSPFSIVADVFPLSPPAISTAAMVDSSLHAINPPPQTPTINLSAFVPQGFQQTQSNLLVHTYEQPRNTGGFIFLEITLLQG